MRKHLKNAPDKKEHYIARCIHQKFNIRPSLFYFSLRTLSVQKNLKKLKNTTLRLQRRSLHLERLALNSRSL